MNNSKRSFRSEELLEAADKLIERIKKADEIDNDKIDASYQEVMKKVQASKSKHFISARHVYRWIASVAAIIVVLIVGALWLREEQNPASTLDVALLDQTLSVSDDEVTLITHASTMNLKDETSLKYDKTGASNAGQYALNKVDQSVKSENQMHQIIVPQGKRANVTLSDGSRIFINSGSKVIYPELFDVGQRTILVEGEVYLEVVKNKKQPFIVKTREFDVEVLGTSFNVCAYHEDKETSVVLVNGSVAVTTVTKDKVALQPNDRMSMCNSQVSVHKVDVDEYIGWKDDMMIISDKPLSEVFRKLERCYGYTIRFNPQVADISVSGKLDLKPSIRRVMDTICLMMKVQYTLNSEEKEIVVSMK